MEGCILNDPEPPNTGSASAGVLSHPRRRVSQSLLMVGKLEPVCLSPVFVSKVSLEHNLIYSFIYCLWLLSHTAEFTCCNLSYDPQSSIPIWCFTESLLASGLYRPMTELISGPPHQRCSCSISVPWGWEFLFSHHHIRKTGCKPH